MTLGQHALESGEFSVVAEAELSAVRFRNEVTVPDYYDTDE